MKPNGWKRPTALVAAILAIAGLAGPSQAGMMPGDQQEPTDNRTDNEQLDEQLRAAVEAQHFRRVVDTMPPKTAENARSSKGYKTVPLATQRQYPPFMPNVDVSVIELDDRGRPVNAANVLSSKRYRDARIVPIDSHLSSSTVRWRKWNVNEWNAGSAGSEDLVAGRKNAPLEFMSTYPASVMKLMVGFGVLRMVDRGELDLDDVMAYRPADSSCGEATSKKVRTWFDEMITFSDNRATCALIKMLHDRGRIDDLNATFSRLGLETLHLTGTSPETGGSWVDTSMTSLDTARLLMIISGGPGTLWETHHGRRVTAAELSARSRRFFYSKLSQQGLNQALSTPNWCGRDYPAPGIPQKVHPRWIDPANGKVTVGGRFYGQDVRPCNAAAEVTFAHKTGLTTHGGADAGIVHALPGKQDRDYIVVMMSNLGTRFIDSDKPASPPGVYDVPYTQKFGQLGKRIDTIMKRRAASASDHHRRRSP